MNRLTDLLNELDDIDEEMALLMRTRQQLVREIVTTKVEEEEEITYQDLDKCFEYVPGYSFLYGEYDAFFNDLH